MMREGLCARGALSSPDGRPAGRASALNAMKDPFITFNATKDPFIMLNATKDPFITLGSGVAR
jgi:hypothetical protein